MKKLYRYFVLRHLKFLLWATPFMTAALITAVKLGVPYMLTFTLLPFLILGASSYGTSRMAQNLSWILILPLRKREILFANLLVKLTIVFNSLIAVGLSYVISAMILEGAATVGENLRQMAEAIWTLLVPEGALSPTLAFFSITSLVLPLLAFFQISSAKKPFSAPWSPDKKTYALIALVIFLALIFGSLVNNGFFYFSLTTLLSFYLIRETLRAVSFPKRITRKIMAAVCGFLFFQIAAIFAAGQADLHSGKTQNIAEALEFMGPWSGPNATAATEKLLMSELDRREFVSLAESYLSRKDQKKLNAQNESAVKFENVIKAQKKADTLVRIFHLYDPATPSFAQIEALTLKLDKLLKNERADFFLYNLVRSDLSTKQVIKLLESKTATRAHVGILNARYRSESKLIQTIQKQIGRYPDPLKLEALMSLSVLNGKRLGIDDLNEIKNSERKLASTSLDETSCEGLAPESIKALEKADPSQLNFCVRRKALKDSPGTIQRVEAGGWYESPFTSAQLSALKALYKLSE